MIIAASPTESPSRMLNPDSNSARSADAIIAGVTSISGAGLSPASSSDLNHEFGS
jgi:hypothetical protein